MSARDFRKFRNTLPTGNGKGGHPQFGLAGGRPFNHYTCEACGKVTTTKHEQDGVTPFMLGCRATEGCRGMATSSFYRGPQHEPQLVHVTWVRPEGEELERLLSQFDGANQEWARQHYAQGGCLIKEGPF